MVALLSIPGRSAPTLAALDLSRAETSELANGLTLVVLEDHTLPVVSVQMLYKVGARNEEVGRTGLAHFLEHMAFRATENFPDTEVVSSIYRVGGEWHGYTWIDQTTYYETVPREQLDLILRIEADRMSGLLLPTDEVEAERGAVLSELHGYENDPATVLLDTVVATSFLQHPYRNNTIGWESDVDNLTHADVVEFYRVHYRPANAVLAVVGDVESSAVRQQVFERFGSFVRQDPTPPLRTVEPAQRGERRIWIDGSGGERRFVIAYRAPASGSAEWPAFLLLQEILGGGEGVNFLQNDWGVPVRPGSRLDGISGGLSSWYPPAEYPYLFVISGTASDSDSMSEIEDRIEERVAALRSRAVDPEELEDARARVAESLIFDVLTTEDAAHQLATYVGFGALTELIDLPNAIERVSARQLQQVAATYLVPERRTLGRYLPGEPPGEVEVEDVGSKQGTAGGPPPVTVQIGRGSNGIRAGTSAVDGPWIRYLSGGLPVLFQRIPLSPTVCVRLLVPTVDFEFPGETHINEPVWGWTSLDRNVLAVDFATAADDLRQSLDAAVRREPPLPATELVDPAERLEAAFEALLGIRWGRAAQGPAVLAVVGDLDLEPTLEVLETRFGDLTPPARSGVRPLALEQHELVVSVPFHRSQAQLGYVVPAPPPGWGDALTWRMLLYILTHGYEGRLGKEAISRRGLLYYIDSSYRSDGSSSWIALSMGVDPPKLEATRQLLIASLAELEKRPPTEAEIRAARSHLIGRWRSGAQSNREVSARLVEQWIAHRQLRSEEDFVTAVEAVSREDVLRAIPEFIDGAVVVVEVPE